MQNGLKATTMDSLASSLQISKRTLYEIFSSKENMFLEAFDYGRKKTGNKIREIFQNSSNVMEGILKCFLLNRDIMSSLNVEFLREVNLYYESLYQKEELEKLCETHYVNLYDVLRREVDEGFFREDLNLKVQCRMLMIQMESLKRMEELFPQDITLLEVYDNIVVSFLRGLTTPKGLNEFEILMEKFKDGTLKD